MITHKEILEHSRKYGIRAATIDKDWILGHFLNAFYSFEEVGKLFVFKGGTCIKKCYIEDYRFSEDLDFTLLDKNFIVNKQFINSVIKKAEENSGAKFYLSDEIKNQKSEDVPQGYEVAIKYWGADHQPNQRPLPAARWQTKIKLDISFSEKLILEPVPKKILHVYSDSNVISSFLTVYNYSEIVSEKIRSLVQRNRPRDIYDNWYFSRTVDIKEYPEIKRLLYEKAKLKGIYIENIGQFVNGNKERKNKRAWQSNLQHLVGLDKLPGFDEAYSALHTFIENILNS